MSVTLRLELHKEPEKRALKENFKRLEENYMTLNRTQKMGVEKNKDFLHFLLLLLNKISTFFAR
jgi:hypothetical protein